MTVMTDMIILIKITIRYFDNKK